jgi:putative ubiquitin-RnfH superfamily antitoxin RatB of RatAB toxin-antitoxin module
MTASKGIQVEVAYATLKAQVIRKLILAPGTSIEQAIRRSGLLQEFPEIDLTINRVGIFAALARLSDKVRDGDRIEIYRPLIADPKEARRRRALKRAK